MTILMGRYLSTKIKVLGISLITSSWEDLHLFRMILEFGEVPIACVNRNDESAWPTSRDSILTAIECYTVEFDACKWKKFFFF